MIFKFKPIYYLFALQAILLVSFNAKAATPTVHPVKCEITTDSKTWIASSTKVTSCVSGTGSNPDAATVASKLGIDASNVKNVAGFEDNTSEGSTHFFNVTLDPGYSWGETNVSGTWSIDKLFWNEFKDAAISIKGGQNYAIFSVEPGTNLQDINALWSLIGKGNGVSNIKLWGVNHIPEPSVMGLFGIGFASLVYFRRKKKKNV